MEERFGSNIAVLTGSKTMQSARETNLAKKTGEIFSGVGRQAQTSYSKALENERVRFMFTTCKFGCRTLDATTILRNPTVLVQLCRLICCDVQHLNF